MDIALYNERSNESLQYIIDRNEKYKRYIQLGEIHRDMKLHEFLAFHEIDFTKFGLPLQFWYDLNNVDDDHFFEITDEVIEAIGFSKPKSMYRFIRKNFREHIDYTEELVQNTGVHGVHRIVIKMKKRPFKQLLMKVGTETSETLHTYLIEFEEACVEYMRYQYACTQETIRESREMLCEAPLIVDDNQDSKSVVKVQTFDDFCRHVNTQVYKTTREENIQQIAGVHEKKQIHKT